MNNNQQNWSEYFKNTKDGAPSSLLVKAVQHVVQRNRAIDIGGGALKDTRYLLSQGFETTVIDQAEEVREIAKTVASDKLHCYITSFIDYTFPINTFDLTSAMYALPFSASDNFEKVLVRAKGSLVKGGIFSGNLFGVHDDWSNRANMTFHTKMQVESFFSDFEMILFEEKEYDGKMADGQSKHWNVFNIIARKTSL